MRIQFAEKVQLKASIGHSEFDAYGRRFSLDLERNERLLAGLPETDRASLAQTQLLRGKLDGAPGSWVRLTRVDTGLEGAIWDGHDLYVVSTLGRIANNLTTPIEAASSQTVLYRLSDTLDGLPEAFCGLEEHLDAVKSKNTGLTQYQALIAQLSATVPADQLDIALVADTSFQQASTNARDSMLSRLNTVDGIFAGQLGVLLSPTEFRLVAANEDPFTATDASQLLQQLSNYRKQTPSLRTPGLVHLITNKALDGNTIGIAYLDSLCDPSRGVSLSNTEMGFLSSALVMAHELGHNFGAEHDGEAGGACATVPYGYIMWPSFNGGSIFSGCSVGTMAQSIARARGSCISAPRYADLGAVTPAVLDANTNVVFTLPVTVRSVGNIAAVEGKLRLSLPPNVVFESAVLANGACAVAGNLLSCTLGDIPAATDVPVELKLSSSSSSSVNLEVIVTAANDHLQSNQLAQTSVRFSSAVDLGLALSVSPASAYANDNIDIVLDVSSLRSQPAGGGKLFVRLGSLKYDSATDGAHTCTAQFNEVICDLADVPSGATTRIVLHTHGEDRGETSVSAQLQLAGDGDSSNNSRGATVTVIPESELILTVSQSSLSFVTGTAQQVTFTVRAAGRIPSVNTQLLVSPPWNGVVDSIVPSAGTCSGAFLGTCDFGTLAPGNVRTLVVHFHTTSNGYSALQVESRHQINPNLVRTGAIHTQLYSNLQIDVIASILGASTLEGRPGTGFAGVETVGVQPAQNVVATLTVPAAMRVTAINVTNDVNWSCSILTAQRARCTGNFIALGGVAISYAYESDVPGRYPATLEITANGDLNASNNTSQAMIDISPYLDVGITTTETEMLVVAGEDRTVGFTVTTGNRAVPEVVVIANPGPDIAAMSASGTPCSIGMNGAGRCDLGGVPANASIPVSVTYRTTRDNSRGAVTVNALASNDSNPANNSAQIIYMTVAYTDVRLQVAAPSATAVNGAQLHLPAVTVVNGGNFPTRDAIVQIPLPAFATVAQISGSGVNCTGNPTLTCEFSPIEAGTSRTLDIWLATSGTGTFNSNIRLLSANDSTAANNVTAVALSVTAASGGGGGSSGGGASGGGGGGGGGGGRFEWLALGFLALLGVNRARRVRLQPRVMSRH